MRICHVITRLILGGAQENTIASVARVDPSRYESHLWTGPQTGSEGSLMSDARSRGIALIFLVSSNRLTLEEQLREQGLGAWRWRSCPR